jgi:hypothetical protein
MGEPTPCCPACHRPYYWGDEACGCGALLERATGGPLEARSLPVLDKHGPPPSDVPEYWLEIEGTSEVRFRGNKGTQFPLGLGQGPLLIGRRDPQTGNYPEIDLSGVADFGYTARRHARLSVERGKLFLTDLKGDGTTAINEIRNPLKKDAPAELKGGDRIIIGEAVTMRVIVHEAD